MITSILFRLNAGKLSGMGHLSRNLVLAGIFDDYQVSCTFLIQTDDENLVTSFLKNKSIEKYKFHFFSTDVDFSADISLIKKNYINSQSFLILDHYFHNDAYQKELKKLNIQWAQFDYLKSKKIMSDIIINPNIGVFEREYYAIARKNTKLCIGIDYIIIGKEFRNKVPKKQFNRILIAMGGGKYPQEVIDMVVKITSNHDFIFDVVTSDITLISLLQGHENIEMHLNPINISDFYARNSVAFVAGGVASYELAILKIPLFIIPYAANQVLNAIALDINNFGIGYRNVNAFSIILSIKNLSILIKELNDKYLNKTIEIDGFGADRIVKKILKFKKNE